MPRNSETKFSFLASKLPSNSIHSNCGQPDAQNSSKGNGPVEHGSRGGNIKICNIWEQFTSTFPYKSWSVVEVKYRVDWAFSQRCVTSGNQLELHCIIYCPPVFNHDQFQRGPCQDYRENNVSSVRAGCVALWGSRWNAVHSRVDRPNILWLNSKFNFRSTGNVRWLELKRTSGRHSSFSKVSTYAL